MGSHTGIITTKKAPQAGPKMVAAPPTTTATSSVIDRLTLYFSAFTNGSLNTDSAPATPASMALTPNVSTL